MTHDHRTMAQPSGVASAVTGMCLVNTNEPLAEHIHVCTREAYQAHERHRCHCGSEWTSRASERS